ncbi:MAG: hypothetical protein VM34scaffold347_41 [Phage 66_12]|nr:MAG: hypothetical protein VM34scaffold347_41 [Phage 66_12]
MSGPGFTDYTPGYGPGGGQWRSWDPERKDALRQRLEDELERRRTMWGCDRQFCDGSPHGKYVMQHARWNQLPPPDLPRLVRTPDSPVPVEVSVPWLEWLIMSGRGWGKTRTGAEFVKERAKVGRGHRIALIGRTAADVRDTMIEGESGLLSVYRRTERPDYQPSKRRVVFQNGAIAYAYSSDEPDQLRGPQHHTGWVDELATFGNLDKVISNYRLGMRLGRTPRVVVTTTPRPRKEIREMRRSPSTVVTGGTTYENLVNLAPVFQEQTYGGDETGILVVGKLDDEGFVLADLSGHFSPHDWARTAIQAATSWGAGYLVAEKNQGGEMVLATLQSVGLPRGVRYRGVTASKGKRLRAEPISTLYERGMIHHVGVLAKLEDQMTTWTPADKDSPDRLDALVWACSHLFFRRRGMADVA